MSELFKRAIMLPMVAMLAIQIMGAIATQSIPLLAPEAARAYGLPVTLVGLFTAIMYGTSALGGLVGGPLVVRSGAVRTAQISLLLFFIGPLVFTLAEPVLAVATAIIIGIGYGFINPSASHVLAKNTPDRWRPLVFSLKQTGVPIGGALAGAVLTAITAAYGWEWAAVAAASGGIFLALLVWPLRREFDADRNTSQSLAIKSLAGPVKTILADPTLRIMSIAGFTYGGAQVVIFSYFVVFLTESVGTSLVDAGLAYSAFQAGGLAGRLGWGVIAGWMVSSRVLLIFLGFLMTGGLCITATFTPEWPMPAIAGIGFLLGTGVIGWNGLYLAEVARLAPAGRISEVTGGAQVFLFSGPILIPPLFALLIETTDYMTAFLVTAAMTFLAAVCMALRPGAR